MKFSCQRCQTRYSIADEKVRGKILKVRCKTCAELIIVRERSGARLRDVARQPASPPPIPSASPPSGPPPPPAPEASAATWFWSADGQTGGPVSEESLLASCRANELVRHTHVWREGMDVWEPITKVSPFAAALPTPAVPPPLPPPAPAPLTTADPDREPFKGQRPLDTLDLSTDELLPSSDEKADQAGEEADQTDEAADQAQHEPAEATADEESEEPSSSTEASEQPQLSTAEEESAEAPSPASEEAASDRTGPALELDEESAEEEPPDDTDEPTSDRGISEELQLDLSGLFPTESDDEAGETSSEAQLLAEADPAALDAHPTSQESELTEPVQLDQPALTDEIQEGMPSHPSAGRRISARTMAVALGVLMVGGAVAVKLDQNEPLSPAQETAAAVSTTQEPVSATAEPAPDAPREITFSEADLNAPKTDERRQAKAEPPRDAGPKLGDASSDQGKTTTKRRKKRKRKKKPADKLKGKKDRKADGAALAALAAMESGRGRGSQERGRLQALTSRISADESSAGLSPRTIKAVIKRQRRGITSCLERHLKRQGADSMDSRKVTLSFVIRRKGTTKKVRLSDGLNTSVFGECVKRQVLNWTFPPFAGEEIPVRYPLVLTATQ